MRFDTKQYDISSAPEEEVVETTCDWGGCQEPAPHRAPLTACEQRERPFACRWFCKEHITPYNRSFNYFEGMSDAAASAWQHEALTSGHRPSWPRHAQPKWQEGENRLAHLLAEARLGATNQNGKPADPDTPPAHITAGQERALASLDLPANSTLRMLTQRYKELVKAYHPDHNNGSRKHEADLTRVLQAYNYLKASGFGTT